MTSFASDTALTADEARDVSILRERLSDLASAEGQALAKEYLSEDCTLWRYVLAKSQDDDPMAESEAMFRRSLQWREDIKLAALCEEWGFPKSASGDASCRRWSTARSRMGASCFYGGIMTAGSVSGGPVMVERLGAVDLSGLYSDEYAFDCTTNSYIVYLESAWNQVRTTGRKTRGMIVIDISGAGLSMLSYVSVIKRIASAGVLMYPEINERVTIVNAGWFMSTLWAAVKPFLPKRTESKIRIIDNDYQGTIHPDINGGAEALPSFLGGQLAESQHAVCPAMSVDSAYAAIVEDICSGAAEYPDAEEFLSAALQHAKRQSGSSVHINRAHRIEEYLALNRNEQESRAGVDLSAR